MPTLNSEDAACLASSRRVANPRSRALESMHALKLASPPDLKPPIDRWPLDLFPSVRVARSDPCVMCPDGICPTWSRFRVLFVSITQRHGMYCCVARRFRYSETNLNLGTNGRRMISSRSVRCPLRSPHRMAPRGPARQRPTVRRKLNGHSLAHKIFVKAPQCNVS